MKDLYLISNTFVSGKRIVNAERGQPLKLNAELVGHENTNTQPRCGSTHL